MKTGRPPASKGDIVIINGLPRTTKPARCWPDTEPPHGRYTTYCNYGCRCDPCRDDWTLYVNRRRQALRR